MTPKGTLLIIGGAEDKGNNAKLERERKGRQQKQLQILRLLLHGERKVEIITTASNYHKKVKEEYEKALNIAGIDNTGFIHIEDTKDARLDNYLKRIEKADSIFFSGGDQLRLSTILGGTPFIDLIAKRYLEDKDLIVAGTSAGAMAMSKIMISRGGTSEVVFKNDLKTDTGFGFLDL
ncbi:cyanophycinase [Marivirga sp.]|uniref:cyanophycinase n=1 Tax=Marivirga sp. TaxID=2018662 RepID=UPI002D801948|nr:cyanophycinase [Marivirga sp.]HET8860313.1 cyanophycinase [Marivirga sp.]